MTSPVDFSSFSNNVNGERRSSANLSRTVNPSNRELLWDVPVASEEDVDDAVVTAKQAFLNSLVRKGKAPFQGTGGPFCPKRSNGKPYHARRRKAGKTTKFLEWRLNYW
jgi:hypothetical protein